MPGNLRRTIKYSIGLLPLTVALLLACHMFVSDILIVGAENNNTAIVQFALFTGADIDWHDNHRTALIYAIEHQNANVARLLINRGADVNCRHDENLETALMAAAYYGQVPIAKLLFSKGANINARDKTGRSVLAWAEEGQKDEYGPEVVSMLKRVGAKY